MITSFPPFFSILNNYSNAPFKLIACSYASHTYTKSNLASSYDYWSCNKFSFPQRVLCFPSPLRINLLCNIIVYFFCIFLISSLSTTNITYFKFTSNFFHQFFDAIMYTQLSSIRIIYLFKKCWCLFFKL